MEQMFIKASRLKLRFKAANGNVGVEDLWDLSLKQLDAMAQELRREVNSTEESFIADKKADPKAELSFEIVKFVIATRMAERKQREEAQANAAQAERIRGILAKRQDEALENMDEAALQAELDRLEGKTPATAPESAG